MRQQLHIWYELQALGPLDSPEFSLYPYCRYLLQCEREQEVVKLLLIKGYPMRKLLTDDEEEREEQLALDKTLASMNE